MKTESRKLKVEAAFDMSQLIAKGDDWRRALKLAVSAGAGRDAGETPALRGEYTPGPWHRLGLSIEGANVVNGQSIGITIAKVCENKQSEANARVIEAAPKLLETAIELVSCLDNLTTEQFTRGGERCFREALRRVIARAGHAAGGAL